MLEPRRTLRLAAAANLSIALTLLAPATLRAQAPAAPAATPAPARQLGTVKSVSGNTITIANAAGTSVTVTVDAGAPVLQLPPGSTDLKSATPSALDNIAVGDRILATGKPGDTPDTVLASRIVLMKSSDLAARNEAQQADWQRRGVSGLVKSMDGSTLTVSAGARTIAVQTTPTTVFRRYAEDSVNFQDAKPGTLDQIHPGDQLSVRGAHSDDNLTVTAEEVVTGTFANLSGIVSAVDPATGTVSLKDLATKRPVTVKVTSNSDLRRLPAQAAAAFAARNNPSAGGAHSSADGAPTAANAGSGAAPSRAAGGRPGGYGGNPDGANGPGGGGPGGPGGGGARARAGMDLSRMLARLPAEPLAELKPGDAVMIVASRGRAAEAFTAITLLSGVEQLLSANTPGAAPITLSPWNLSAPEGGGGGGAP